MDFPNDPECDPRSWSIDQVVEELCYNPTPKWSPNDQPQLIPDRQLLENTLRQNHVDGDNLLALDMGVLRDDLGVMSFGQRRAIMKAIEYFRLHSRSYQQMAFQADSIARMQPGTFTPQLSRHSMLPQSPAHAGLGLVPSIEPRQPTNSPSLYSNNFGLQQPTFPQDLSAFESKPPISEKPPSSARRPSELASILPTNSHDTAADKEQPPPTAAEPGSILPQRSKREYVVVNGKKRITPTFLSPLHEGPTETGDGAYLSRTAVPLQDIFYHRISTGFGDIFYRPPVDESSDFLIAGRFSTGQRLGVASHMKHFLRQSTGKLSSGAAYKIPCKDGRVNEPYSEHYFTLFPQDSGRPRVFRAQDYPEIMAILNATTRARKGTIPPVYDGTRDEPGQEEISQWTDLDYLLEKYPVEASDEVLPAYGDSGDEGEFDEDTWREIQEEEAEKIRESSYMTRAEVDTVIDQAIREMRQDWHETKRAKIQLKAWRMWMKAARKKGRQQELTYVTHQKQRFERMMLKTTEAIADDIWRNATEVKKQCQSVEAAVHQHEEYQHYETVLNQDTPPERPSERALRASRGRPKQDLEEGEELIESETEPFTDEEDDLLVDDSSDVGSIHHEPDMEEWNPVIPSITTADGTGVKSAQITPAPTESAKVVPTLELREVDSTPDPQASDADVETSEDEIISPARKKQTNHKTISPMILKIPPKTPAPKHVLSIPADPNQATAAGSESDSESSDFDRAPRLPNTKYRGRGRTKLEPVDLTFSSPTNESAPSVIEDSTDFSVHTPELNPAPKISPGLSKRKREHDDDSGLPPYADVEGMRDEVEWSDLEKMIDNCVPDKRRALAKAVYELEPDTVIDLDRYLKSLAPRNRKDILVSGLLALSDDECQIDGVKPKHLRSAHLLVLLYITFVCGQNMVDRANLTDRCRDDAYADIDKALRPFFDLLDELIHRFKKYEQQSSSLPSVKKKKRDQDNVNVGVLDDADLQMTDVSTDFLAPEEPPSTHKKRKRMVEESQEAKSLQMSDKLRIQEQEERRKKMAKKFAQMTAEGTTITEPVNTTEPYVYLHPHIAQRVKPHQLNGIQFMWREIIEDPKHQGCILAHTMGLGKTMQVVSLLVTIALCNQSEDVSIRNQIPSHLKKSKTLILCPASLVENWYDELLMWTPDVSVLGTIYKHDKPDPNMVAEWSRTGGVLLTGYERFRGAIDKSKKAKKQGNVQVDIEKILLEVPNLVIADEAHRLKNASSGIHKVAKQLKTTSRIALTGSPLNNHLEEYHAMVDWIAPNYLGDIVQFKAKYSEPIVDGLYADSTAFERRVSLRKLHVLKRDLDPKITRADISAIAKDMPPKTEFFITLPLTDIQRQAYNIYVKYMLETMRGQKDKSSRTANIWAWIAMLSWLCHHPSCFLSKMQERAEREREQRAEQGRVDNQTSADEARASNEHSDPTTPDNPEADHDFDISGPMEEALQEVKEIFKDLDQPTLMDDPSLSYRTQAVKEIVRQTMAVGDKTLIFSHSIPTLNYLERMLENMNCSYCRLDGKTKMSVRQAATKKFNQYSGYQVFLISMRAGGLGLNLQGANRVIIFDFSFNPSHEEQAIGRAYRLNQKTPVFVYRFQAGGTFEDVLFNTAIFKTQLFGRVVDKKRPTRHATKNMAEYLFPAKDVPLQDFKECLGKDPEVLDSIIDELDFIRGIVLTETFQKEEDEQLNEEEQKKAEEEYRDEQLLRDNPAAYYAKKAAEQAQLLRKQPQPMYPHSGGYPLPNQLPSSTAPVYAANSTSRPQSGAARFPANREDLDRPPATQQPPSAPKGVSWAYDDTFRDILQQPDTGAGAHSVDDGDVHMNGAE
ncbi:hypothetical protein PV05_10169 [Exophiala xenobiotica]|uniref:Uncharacterized protein n=1 Tax=Exophiala xenobiotica TaxID=348802 RepID=A0A0D2BGY2_9EURO|nr:uncharacterized protein PV05_10169 [Exophiala xenobiotica]KIW51451.1 hypothetical protein PV05_10169 [Exophiala xenobiotica]